MLLGVTLGIIIFIFYRIEDEDVRGVGELVSGIFSALGVLMVNRLVIGLLALENLVVRWNFIYVKILKIYLWSRKMLYAS